MPVTIVLDLMRTLTRQSLTAIQELVVDVMFMYGVVTQVISWLREVWKKFLHQNRLLHLGNVSR